MHHDFYRLYYITVLIIILVQVICLHLFGHPKISFILLFVLDVIAEPSLMFSAHRSNIRFNGSIYEVLLELILDFHQGVFCDQFVYKSR